MMTDIKPISVAQRPKAHITQQKLVINDVTLQAHIGVYDSEQGSTQPIRLWLVIALAQPCVSHTDSYEDVICYDTIVRQIQDVLDDGHVNLVETLSQRIADRLFEDDMIESLTLRIEKPNALNTARGVGVESEFSRHPVSR